MESAGAIDSVSGELTLVNGYEMNWPGGVSGEAPEDYDANILAIAVMGTSSVNCLEGGEGAGACNKYTRDNMCGMGSSDDGSNVKRVPTNARGYHFWICAAAFGT